MYIDPTHQIWRPLSKPPTNLTRNTRFCLHVSTYFLFLVQNRQDTNIFSGRNRLHLILLLLLFIIQGGSITKTALCKNALKCLKNCVLYPERLFV